MPDVLWVDNNGTSPGQNEFFARNGLTVDRISINAVTSYTTAQFLAYRIVYFPSGQTEGDRPLIKATWPALRIAMTNSRLVLWHSAADNASSPYNDYGFHGENYSRPTTGDGHVFPDLNHPLNTGQPYGGVNIGGNVGGWSSTWHGWWSTNPANLKIVMHNGSLNEPIMLEGRFRSGWVVIDTLTSKSGGWGLGNSNFADNLAKYMLFAYNNYTSLKDSYAQQAYHAVVAADSPTFYLPLDDVEGQPRELVGARVSAVLGGGPSYRESMGLFYGMRFTTPPGLAANQAQRIEVPVTWAGATELTLEAWVIPESDVTSHAAIVMDAGSYFATAHADFPVRLTASPTYLGGHTDSGNDFTGDHGVGVGLPRSGVASDSFNRADTNILGMSSSGNAWTMSDGPHTSGAVLGIRNNALTTFAAGVGNEGHRRAVIECGFSNGYVQINTSAFPQQGVTGNAFGMYLIFRYVDDNNFLGLRWTRNGEMLVILVLNGSQSILSRTDTYFTGQGLYKVSFNGPSITATSPNGTLSVINSNFLTATKHGVQVDSDSAGAVQDSWHAESNTLEPLAPSLTPYHIALAYKQNALSEFYVNGESVSSWTPTYALPNSGSGRKWTIGASAFEQVAGGAGISRYLGYMAHVALYPTRLSAEQIRKHYDVMTRRGVTY